MASAPPARAPRLIPLFNPVAARILRLGRVLGPNALLTVRGRKSGVARTYVSTGGPEDFEGIEAGRWITAGGTLTIKWDGGDVTSARYELSNGQLQWSALGARIWVRRP